MAKLCKRKQDEYKWAKYRTIFSIINTVFSLIGLFVSLVILTILLNK